MSHKQLISIIVPIYNVEKYLEKCLNSINEQTYTYFECILIDDCSTDCSLDIANRFVSLDPVRFKLIRNKSNVGLSHSRHNGYQYASGNYIIYVDSDDYLDVKFLEKMYYVASTNNSDIVQCNHYNVGVDNSNLVERNERFTKNKYTDNYLWGRIYKKKFLDKNYSNPVKMFLEDVVFNVKVLSGVPKVSFIDDGLYFYVQRPGSLINSIKNLEELKKSLDNINNSFMNKNEDVQGKVFIFDLVELLIGHLSNKYEQYLLVKYAINLIGSVLNIRDFRLYSRCTDSSLIKLIILYKSRGLYVLRPRFKKHKAIA